MRIGIIGAGFTGLTAGFELVKAGHEVVIFEKEKNVGGLASNFKPEGWQWGAEKYYHHIFANDKTAIKLAKEVGWPAFFSRPVTNGLIKNKKKRLDSALSLLMFDELSLVSRLRMGAGLAILKLINNGLTLERYRLVEILPKLMGKDGYEKVWRPLLMAKFGEFLPQVNMAWFWARVKKRTAKLGYFEGGFGKLAEKIAGEIEKKGGTIKLETELKVGQERFDKLLDTRPSVRKVNYLWGQTLILELDRALMKGYWLNILEKDWPFLVAVEQTNFIDRKNYGNKHIIYLGNYLKDDDKRLKMSEDKLLKLFLPCLKKINSDFKERWIIRKWKFQDPFAQPVFPVNYSKIIAKIKTEIPGIYVANMAMVYPWDRGVNYAVKLGQKAARIIMSDGNTSMGHLK